MKNKYDPENPNTWGNRPIVTGVQLEPMPASKRPEGFYYVQLRNEKWSIAKWVIFKEFGWWYISGDDAEYWDQEFKTIVEKPIPLPKTK